MDTRTEPRPALPRTVADPAMVRAILADPGHTVPDPGTGAPPVTMAWLRQNVARLSSGGDHERRRGLAASRAARCGWRTARSRNSDRGRFGSGCAPRR